MVVAEKAIIRKAQVPSIGVHGPDAQMHGSIIGTYQGNVETDDWWLIYDAYCLGPDEGLDKWIKCFHSDRRQRILQLALPHAKKIGVRCDVSYEVKPDKRLNSDLFVGFHVLKLTLGSLVKQFVITNKESFTICDDKGEVHPGFSIKGVAKFNPQ